MNPDEDTGSPSPGGIRQQGRRGQGKQGRAFLVLALAILVAGLGLLGYPVAMSWYEAWLAERSITTISDVYDNMDDELRLENLSQARAYNAVLSEREPEIPTEEIWDYDRQLTYHDQPTTMMSYIDIPKISSRLPIFHHTTEEALMAGVGHVDSSALPVGGEGTRCVLSAHSGMQHARMFDDIRLLEKGDTFVLWTLSEPYAYRVCDIRVVLPEQAPSLIGREEGRDLCTLITCTPYGVNTHRLLVTGERCEYVEDGKPSSTRAYVNGRTIPLLIGMGIVLTLVVLLIAMHVARRRRGKAQAERPRRQNPKTCLGDGVGERPIRRPAVRAFPNVAFAHEGRS